jgi:signal recognition particle subunit SRP54
MNIPGMRKRSATKSSKANRKGKKGKSQRGRGPTQPRMPAGFPPGAFGPGGLPTNLPPGMEMPDLSKLKLPEN